MIALITVVSGKPSIQSKFGRLFNRLARANLVELGVDMARYGERDYGRTQRIGAALALLEIDGLIAPSARWPCDNLTIFIANHRGGRLEVIDFEAGLEGLAKDERLLVNN